MKKVYKTAQGKIVDFGTLAAQNETVRAVGNMKVNARGDKIDSQGNIIASRAQQINKNLAKQTNTAAGPIPSGNKQVADYEAEQKRRVEEARAARQAKREQAAKGSDQG